MSMVPRSPLGLLIFFDNGDHLQFCLPIAYDGMAANYDSSSSHRVDQLNPNGRESLPIHPLQASIPDQLILSHRPRATMQLIPNS